MAEERTTPVVRGWLRGDGQIATWLWSQVELVGAVERRARRGALDAGGRRASLAAIAELVRSWDEIHDVVAVRSRALVLMGRHDLRAADAAQLGAALQLADGEDGRFPFVCLDRRLAQAAEREGLTVLTLGTGLPDAVHEPEVAG